MNMNLGTPITEFFEQTKMGRREFAEAIGMAQSSIPELFERDVYIEQDRKGRIIAREVIQLPARKRKRKTA
ncbi:MAG: hypothetical protein AAF438_06830 [Pseudomonadota bacterium]